MRRAIRDNGLTLMLGAMFLAAIGGQMAAGVRSYNADQRAHGEPTVTLGAYVRTGHFVESVFEIIAGIQREGTTVLMVEQNAYMALRLATRAYVMETGRIALEGAARALIADPHVRRAYLGG